MAARLVFAPLENLGLPDPTLATLHRAQQALPATTAYPPTADELVRARQLASEYQHVAQVHKIVSPEFQQNNAAAQLYSSAVANLAATRYLTPTPGDGQVTYAAPAQPGPTYRAMRAAGIGGGFLILAKAMDDMKEDLTSVKEDVKVLKADMKVLKADMKLVKLRQQDLKVRVSSLQTRSMKTGQRVKSEAQRLRELNAPYPQDELEAEAAGLWDSDAEAEENHVLWDDEEQERLRREADEAKIVGGPA